MTAPDDSTNSLLGDALASVPAELHAILTQHFFDVSAIVCAGDKALFEDDCDAHEDVQRACVLFIARELAWIHNKGPRSHIGLPVSAIVSLARTNPFEFFRELPVTLNQIQPFLASRGISPAKLVESANAESWSKALQSIHMMSRKYKDTLSRQMTHLPANRSAVMKLGWIMFLVAKARVLPPFPDLVSCVQLLICVINVLVSNSPTLNLIVKSWGGEEKVASTLETLTGKVTGLGSHVVKNDMDLVKGRAASLTAYLETVIDEIPDLPASTLQPMTCGVVTYANTYQGLLTDPEVIGTWTAAFERKYEELYKSYHEIDEREFLHTDLSMFASPAHSPSTTYSFGSKRPTGLSPLGPGSFTKAMGSSPLMSPHSDLSQQTLLYSVMQSPVPRMRLGSAGEGCSTPITQAMQATQWLCSVVGPNTTSSEPLPVPASLAQYLQQADPGLVYGISVQVHGIMREVWPDNEQPPQFAGVSSVSGSTPEHRNQAIRLYYHTLELVLAAEARSSSGSFAQLMGSSTFHRGLLACCVEVVIGAHQMPSYEFPYVLKPLKLKAFDLLKIVQPFVKSLPAMPRELKRHMFLIEEKVLQSLAWEAGSSVYPLIKQVACGAVPSHGSSRDQTNTSSQECDVTTSAASLGALNLDCSSVQDDGSTAGAMPNGSGSVGAKRDHISVLSVLSSPAKRVCPSPVREPTAPASAADASTSASQSSEDSIPASIGHVSLSSAPAGTKASVAIVLDFLRKVLKLCAFRLSLMLGDSQLARDLSPHDPRDVHRQVMEALEEILYYHTHLFYNRHIDQVILCTFYGFCKSHQLGMTTMKKIILYYKKQVKVSQSTLASAILKQSLSPEFEVQARGDLYAFYNQTFLPTVCPSPSGGLRWKGSRATWLAEAGLALSVASPKPGPMGLPPRAPSHQSCGGASPSDNPCTSGNNSSCSTQNMGSAASQGHPPTNTNQSGHGGSIAPGVQRFFPSLRPPSATPDAGSPSTAVPAQSPRQVLMPPPPPRAPRPRPAQCMLDHNDSSNRTGMAGHIPNGLAALLHAVDSTHS